MTTPKLKDWKIGVFVTDPDGGSLTEITENITQAVAKSRALTMCKNGCWLDYDDGSSLLIPPHRIRGIFIKKMEKPKPTAEAEKKPKAEADA